MENAGKIVKVLIIFIIILLGGINMMGCTSSFEDGIHNIVGKCIDKALRPKKAELPFAHKYGDETLPKITLGMSKERVKYTWGDPQYIEKGIRMDYDGLEINADEFWSYPRRQIKSRDRIEYYKLYFKNDVLIKIIEVSAPIK